MKPSLTENLINKDFLNTDIMYQIYDEYFDFMKFKWPNTSFIFCHFPILKETREIYISRWNKIADVIENLSGKYNIQNIHADNNKIFPNEDSDAYHYTDETAQNMASKIKI